MDLRFWAFWAGMALALVGCAAAAWTRDRLGVVVMTALVVLLAWAGRGMFMSH
jgi:hypothetical protein